MPSREQALRDGLLVGLIAYGSVIVVYTALDLLGARGPFFTVNLLGHAVLEGAAGAVDAGASVSFGAIALFNGIHLVLSLLIGVVVLQLVAFAQREQRQALVVILAIVSGFALTVAVVGWWSAPFRSQFSWASIILANVVAVMLSVLFIVRYRPDVMDRVVPHAHG